MSFLFFFFGLDCFDKNWIDSESYKMCAVWRIKKIGHAARYLLLADKMKHYLWGFQCTVPQSMPAALLSDRSFLWNPVCIIPLLVLRVWVRTRVCFSLNPMFLAWNFLWLYVNGIIPPIFSIHFLSALNITLTEINLCCCRSLTFMNVKLSVILLLHCMNICYLFSIHSHVECVDSSVWVTPAVLP